ncbi:MAG: hypothetical protein WCL29_05555 [Pseudomonadota bacterium]
MQAETVQYLYKFPVLLLALLLNACTTQAPITRDPSAPGSPTRAPQRLEASRTATQQRLISEASALLPLATSEPGKLFLQAAVTLPAMPTRIAYRDDNTHDFFSAADAAALPEERRKKLAPIELDEYRYYYTKYGTPLAYVRALDLAAAQGFSDVKGMRILDFGYGSIGHLRLLAGLGAYTVGVDPDSYLKALYSQSSDQGAVPPARELYRGAPGTVILSHGRWPRDGAVAEMVNRGGPYQLILSKNTLKRGYLKPERRANKNQLIDLGVSDEVFLKSVYQALVPGGLLVVYNLAPKQNSADKPYLPHADARVPFTREQFAKAGFTVIAFDTEDHDFVRRMGAAVGWDKNDKGEVVNDLSTNLFAIYTIVSRAK